MRSLPVLGLILTGLVASGLLGLFSPLIRFTTVFLLVSYLTGEVLRSRFGLGNAIGRTVGAALAGLAAHAVLAWLCGLLALSLSTYTATLLGFCFVLFAVTAVRDWRGKARHAPPSRAPLAVLAVAVLIASYLIVLPPPTTPEGDGYDHVGYVRTIMTEGDLTPAGVLAPAAGDEGFRDDPRKGALHPLLAVVCKLSLVDPADAWRWLLAFLAPLAVLAFWRFSRSILPDGVYAAACLILFLMFQGGLARDFFSTIAYGQHLSLVFYWAMFVAALRYARAPEARGLVTIALLLVGGALIHVEVAIHFALAIAALLVCRKTFASTWRGAWTLALTSLVCAAVVIGWKVTVSHGTGNQMHLHPQGLLYLTDTLYVPSPIELLKRYGLLFPLALVMVPLLFLLRRHRRHAWMCLALAAPALLLAANPWVAPLIYERAGYLLHRFLLNVPAFPITVLVLGAMVRWARTGRLAARVVAVLVLIVWGRVFLMSASAWASDMASIRPVRSELSEAQRGLAAWMEERIDPGAIVLSDPATSYWLSAYTRCKVVTVLHQHGTPNDARVFERLSDVRVVLSPFTTQIETEGVLRKYSVDYVLVDATGRVSASYMAAWHPQFADRAADKFAALTGYMELVHASDGFMLYKITGRPPEDEGWYPTVPFIRPRPSGAVACGRRGESGRPRVTSIHIDPAVALPGETVRLTIGYQRDRDVESPLPLLLYLRFEDTGYFANVRSFPGDKILRRYRERREGVFYRFRFDRRPFGDLYTAEMWPLGLEVFETTELRLPAGLREADYQIQVRLTHETLIPNFSLRDVLYNDDRYAGSPCGEIKIRRQVSR